MSAPLPARDQLGWVLLPLRAFLGCVYLYAGVSKVADRRFLGSSSPLSMHASVLAVRDASPIGGLLGPVAAHSFAFGVLIAVAEVAVGIGILLGLFARVAAAGGMGLALSLWLTVSWGARPWFTSADLVYLFALTPLLQVGTAGVLSVDGWLDRVRASHPGRGEDHTRRALIGGAGVVFGGLLLAGAALARRSPASKMPPAGPVTLTATADVPVGGGTQITDPVTDDPAWVLQLQAGTFTAFDAICPHMGCTVAFVSAADGFACPCHGSRFDAQGRVLVGPASRGLTPIPVVVEGGEVRTG